MAPFIVKLLEHKTALGAFLPRQVGTKSANEASKTGRERKWEQAVLGRQRPSRPLATEPRDKADAGILAPNIPISIDVKYLKQMPSFKNEKYFYFIIQSWDYVLLLQGTSCTEALQ